MVRVEKLSKTYGSGEVQVEALKPCTFTIGDGEQVAVVGASGSGKSTLLHLLSGLDTPTSGAVFLDGVNLSEKSDEELSLLRRREIGFIFQSYNLVPELTARENILLPVLLDGKKRAEEFSKAYLDEIVERLELNDRLEHLPGQLSGGQQQRVAIARALINRPQMILCDEPTGNLDSQSAGRVIGLLNDFSAESNITLIVVTHNEAIARQYPRNLTLRDGTVGGDLG